jgi:hypothetical protein
MASATSIVDVRSAFPDARTWPGFVEMTIKRNRLRDGTT